MSTGVCSQLVTSLVVMGHLCGDLVRVLETMEDDGSLTPSPPDMGLGELLCILRELLWELDGQCFTHCKVW